MVLIQLASQHGAQLIIHSSLGYVCLGYVWHIFKTFLSQSLSRTSLTVPLNVTYLTHCLISHSLSRVSLAVSQLPLPCFTRCLISCFRRRVGLSPHRHKALLHVDYQFLWGGAAWYRKLHLRFVHNVLPSACACLGGTVSHPGCGIHRAIMACFYWTASRKLSIPIPTMWLGHLLRVVGLCDLPKQQRNVCNSGGLKWLMSMRLPESCFASQVKLQHAHLITAELKQKQGEFEHEW